jgi:hypothetical protein
MPLSIKEFKTTIYKLVQATLFTRIHSHLSRNNYYNLKKEASDLACEVGDITYNWSQSATGKEYGILVKIIGKDEYNHLTNLTWV